MKLIANGINNSVFSNILPHDDDEVDGVFAAIAYGSLPNSKSYDLIEDCISKGYRMDLWMRYDHTVPVSIEMLKKLLENEKKNIFTKFIKDILHSKIIWWKGYGAYIGSANLTERGWISNIEAGVFFDEKTLQNNEIGEQIESFFDTLKSIDSIPLTKEYIFNMQEMENAQNEARQLAIRNALKKRKESEHPGLHSVDKKDTLTKQKEQFKINWDEGLTQLRQIAKILDESYKPTWLTWDTKAEWHVDQFLHAYYEHKIKGENNSKPYEHYHIKNKPDPYGAVKEALSWWKQLGNPPSGEEQVLTTKAPESNYLLSKNKVKNLNKKEFGDLLKNINAVRTHVTKIEPSLFSRPRKTPIPVDDRITLFADYLETAINRKGQNIKELLDFVLYQGTDENLWERVFTAGKDEAYKIPHIGLNIISEMVGWARPEITPPRNSRTNKALRALGFYVTPY